ncbi:hypothetical protein FDECE_11826 [Fusarium decemcellulare]|nr:hypothetical protein FDECE_11826 [Fusarium decemcellulare]
MPCYRTLAPRARNPRTVEPLTRPNGVSPKQRRHHHSAAAWEARKPYIVQIYVCENRPAKEVVEILQKDFNFEVCLRKLRTKLQEWGIYKTLNHSDADLRTQSVRRRKGISQSRVSLPTGDNAVNQVMKQNDGILTTLSSTAMQPLDARHVITDRNGEPAPLTQSMARDSDGRSWDISAKNSGDHAETASESVDDYCEESRVENFLTLQPKTYCLKEEISKLNHTRHRHILKDHSISRETNANCSNDLPQNPQTSTTVFEVSIRYKQVDVTIFSEDLYSGLRSLFPLRLWEEGRCFNGQLLLMNYTRLRKHVENLRTCGRFPTTNSDLIEEWELLVDGFVGNHSAFRHFDLSDPTVDSVLDNQLRVVFAQQRLEGGIDSFNDAFVKTDEEEIENSKIRTEEEEEEEEEALRTEAFGLFVTTRGALHSSFVPKEFRSFTALSYTWGSSPMDAGDASRRRLDFVDVAHDAEIEQEEKLKLQKFRKKFIRQYLLLKRATKDSSTELHQIAAKLRGYRNAWAASMTAMRQLIRLKPPTLLGALCFLCTSRAMADSSDSDRGAYLSQFTKDLEQWRNVFPEVTEAARLMWSIDIEGGPSASYQQPGGGLQCPFLLPLPIYQSGYGSEDAMLQLRETVAALIGDANEAFSLDMNGDLTGGSESDEHQDWAKPERSPPQATAWEAEFQDILVAPHITSLQGKFWGTSCFHVLILVTGIIFSLAVAFILGYSNISFGTLMGQLSPWYMEPESDSSTAHSFGDQEMFDPSLLSRPSTPLERWQPCLNSYSDPTPPSNWLSSDVIHGN